MEASPRWPAGGALRALCKPTPWVAHSQRAADQGERVSTARGRYGALVRRPGIAGAAGRRAAGPARRRGGAVWRGSPSFSQRHDFGAAGTALATRLIATLVTAPRRGRLVDRFSPRTVLPLMVLGFAAAVYLGALAAAERAPVALPVALLVPASPFAPPTTAVLRTLWSAIAAYDREASAFQLACERRAAVNPQRPIVAAINRGRRM
jgi:hypothetical protein